MSESKRPQLPPLRMFRVAPDAGHPHVTVTAHRYDIYGDFVQFVDYVSVRSDDGEWLVQTLGRRMFYRPLQVEEVEAAVAKTTTVQ